MKRYSKGAMKGNILTHALRPGGGGVCEQSEVFGFALASSSLTILSARSEFN